MNKETCPVPDRGIKDQHTAPPNPLTVYQESELAYWDKYIQKIDRLAQESKEVGPWNAWWKHLEREDYEAKYGTEYPLTQRTTSSPLGDGPGSKFGRKGNS